MNKSQIQGLAIALMTDHGLWTSGWRFAWDNGRRRAGCCHYSTRTLSFSFVILGKASDEDIRNTILHEIAHALVGPKHGHDLVWRNKHIEIGGDGAQHHKMETPKGRYEMHCVKCGVIGHRHMLNGNLKYATEARARAEYPMYTHQKCGAGIYLVDTKAPKAPEVQWTQVPGAAPGVMTAPWTPPTVATPAQRKAAQTAARKVTAPAGPTCYCRCGGTTRGGMYLPGHDARHVSEIFQRWIASEFDVDGAAQYLAHAPKLEAKFRARVAAYAEKNYK